MHSNSTAFLVTQTVKIVLAVQKTWVPSLDWEDPLENGMVTHSSIFAWRIPQTEQHGGLQFMGSQRVRHNWSTSTFTFLIVEQIYIFARAKSEREH